MSHGKQSSPAAAASADAHKLTLRRRRVNWVAEKVKFLRVHLGMSDIYLNNTTVLCTYLNVLGIFLSVFILG